MLSCLDFFLFNRQRVVLQFSRRRQLPNKQVSIMQKSIEQSKEDKELNRKVPRGVPFILGNMMLERIATTGTTGEYFRASQVIIELIEALFS